VHEHDGEPPSPEPESILIATDCVTTRASKGIEYSTSQIAVTCSRSCDAHELPAMVPCTAESTSAVMSVRHIPDLCSTHTSAALTAPGQQHNAQVPEMCVQEDSSHPLVCKGMRIHGTQALPSATPGVAVNAHMPATGERVYEWQAGYVQTEGDPFPVRIAAPMKEAKVERSHFRKVAPDMDRAFEMRFKYVLTPEYSVG
jgi:hypothetical protein